jgi:hypothetical protein
VTPFSFVNNDGKVTKVINNGDLNMYQGDINKIGSYAK